MPSLTTRVQHYLETLGVPATKVRHWPEQSKLPYFLQDTFDYGEVSLLGKEFVLALDRQEKAAPAREIRARLDRVEAIAGRDAVYVADMLAPYQRKRLIDQRVPFIVPGNQLFIPALLDVRERFRNPPAAVKEIQLAPSTQAMLFALLLDPERPSNWLATQVGTQLGYSPMTVTRAVRELEKTGLVEAHVEGRFQRITLAGLPRQTWIRAQPFIRSPVHRLEWAGTLPTAEEGIRLAGMSALAELTMLAEPSTAVYAMTRADWRRLAPNMEANRPGAYGEGYEIQLWNYTPALQPGRKTVDPLSLIVSLRDHPDERVQIAIDELQEQLQW